MDTPWTIRGQCVHYQWIIYIFHTTMRDLSTTAASTTEESRQRTNSKENMHMQLKRCPNSVRTQLAKNNSRRLFHAGPGSGPRRKQAEKKAPEQGACAHASARGTPHPLFSPPVCGTAWHASTRKSYPEQWLVPPGADHMCWTTRAQKTPQRRTEQRA